MSPIEGGQLGALIVAAVGLFLLLPLGWFLLIVGLVGVVLLTALEQSRRPAPAVVDIAVVETEPETDGA